RWKLINKALDLPYDEPIETYSTSDHLFQDMGIDRNVKGRLKPAAPKEPRTEGGRDGQRRDGQGGDRNRGRSRSGGSTGSAGSGEKQTERRPQTTSTDQPQGEGEGQARRRRRRRTRGGQAAEGAPQAAAD